MKNKKFFQEGEITTIIALGTMAFVLITSITSTFIVKKPQTTSTKAFRDEIEETPRPTRVPTRVPTTSAGDAILTMRARERSALTPTVKPTSTLMPTWTKTPPTSTIAVRISPTRTGTNCTSCSQSCIGQSMGKFNGTEHYCCGPNHGKTSGGSCPDYYHNSPDHSCSSCNSSSDSSNPTAIPQQTPRLSLSPTPWSTTPSSCHFKMDCKTYCKGYEGYAGGNNNNVYEVISEIGDPYWYSDSGCTNSIGGIAVGMAHCGCVRPTPTKNLTPFYGYSGPIPTETPVLMLTETPIPIEVAIPADTSGKILCHCSGDTIYDFSWKNPRRCPAEKPRCIENLFGCSCESDPNMGAEGGRCYQTKSCDSGLICSDTGYCRRPNKSERKTVLECLSCLVVRDLLGVEDYNKCTQGGCYLIK